MDLGNMANVKTVLSTVASVAATGMLVRSVAKDIIPKELRSYFFSSIHALVRHFSSQFTIVIEEFHGMSVNLVFEAVDMYVGAIVSPSTRRVKLGKSEDDKNLVVTVDIDEDIVDVFENAKVKWKLIFTEVKSESQKDELRDLNASLRSEIRSYELTFHKKNREVILDKYLPYILERAKAIKQEGKAIKFHACKTWGSEGINLLHPMNFSTLAMDSKLKNSLIEDLENFVKSKDYYRRIGKSWKRGYLLYGPPGTGKSSLIAAMANYLNYDIYDLDLTEVNSNTRLRSLLLGMTSQSILVIEDIDCSIKLPNREAEDEPDKQQSKITLSGLLNFIDGIWSCCGEERIIIITTNHLDRLDPALLRPGRMDMHIHMSYCTFSAFQQLAFNYLGVSHHEVFDQIEGILEEAEVTPADVAGELIRSNDPTTSLQGFLEFLQNKIRKNNEAKGDTDLAEQIEPDKKETEDQHIDS